MDVVSYVLSKKYTDEQCANVQQDLTQHKQDYTEQINGLKDEKRILRYNKQSQGWEKFRAELPFRVQNIKTIEDWTNPTGWRTGIWYDCFKCG